MRGRTRALVCESLEPRALLNAARPGQSVRTQAAPQLTPADVKTLLQRAAGASSSTDAIIAVVDRNGTILGVRVESGVDLALLADPVTETFAIDGAVAKARTAAMFANSQAPLTSRTIQLISQSTMIERVINSNPNIPDPDSTARGPGFVAPVGPKGHFPPGVAFTPQVDLFLIEHSNRDSIVSPGPDRIRGTADDIVMSSRFNVDPAFIAPGVVVPAPESYGYATGLLDNSTIQLPTPGGGTQSANSAQSRGIATLPGGIPIYKHGNLVGGIGVFFPGTTAYATAENSSLNGAGVHNPAKPDRSLEAEFIAFKTVGGSRLAGYPFGPAPFGQSNGFTLPFGRIDLVGITLDLFGGHGLQGFRNLLTYGKTLKPGNPNDGTDMPVDRVGNLYLPGRPAPQGWLVEPHDGTGLTAADVEAIVTRGIAEADRVRAAIRLPLDSTAKMVFAVNDLDGNLLGLYRMPDATTFSIDVAVAKGRNVAYYADPAELQPEDKISNVPAGTAFTNRTFRYLTLPRFPEGIENNPPGPFSILNDPGVLRTGRIVTALPPSAYTSIQGHDAFYPATNFHDPFNVANQNGVVFFPGAAPLYKDLNGDGVRELVGGLGVSGDGVDQDDDVTYVAAQGYTNPVTTPRADQVKVRGVRLPFIKFNRQPHVPLNQPPLPAMKFRNIPAPKPVSHQHK